VISRLPAANPKCSAAALIVPCCLPRQILDNLGAMNRLE
jgi:hypothetical protein